MSRTDAVWSEQDTTPDAIEGALRELLAERHAESESFVPARVLNMIVFVEDEWSGEIANRLRKVGRYHASRLLVLSHQPRRERLDARVTIVADTDPAPGELALLRETVIVRLGDRHLDDLFTIADPLLVSDLPTLLWSPHGHPEAADALLALAQAALIDSIDEPVWRSAIDRACSLSKRVYVVDLAWLRSTPWRERVAATFDPPRMRSELEVPGLGGVALASESGLRLALDREPGGLRARRRDPDGEERTWKLLGASRGEGGILGEGIRAALLRDPTYAPALRAAQAMLPEETHADAVAA